MKALCEILKKIREFDTPHTRDTPVRQTYWRHGWTAWKGAFKFQCLSFISAVHGTTPEYKPYQFKIPHEILKICKILEDSGRHDKEIEDTFGPERVEQIKARRENNNTPTNWSL